MVLWGFISQFLYEQFLCRAGLWRSAVGGYLGGTMFRGQPGFSLVHGRNVVAQYGSSIRQSLRPLELVVSWMIMSLVCAPLASFRRCFCAFRFITTIYFDLGLPLVGLFFNLIVMGWIIGLLYPVRSYAWEWRRKPGLDVDFYLGAGIGSLLSDRGPADMATACCPVFCRAHAFEGMCLIIVHHSLIRKFLIYAASLNAVYMVGAMGFFLYMR